MHARAQAHMVLVAWTAVCVLGLAAVVAVRLVA